MKHKDLKLFVVRKYIWAKDANSAIQKDKTHKVEEIWVDEEWKKNSNNPKDAIGFYVPH
jgi:hypothetical protein